MILLSVWKEASRWDEEALFTETISSSLLGRPDPFHWDNKHLLIGTESAFFLEEIDFFRE
jgi:hypothetical protein